MYYQDVGEVSILRKNDLALSTFGQTDIKNRIIDILRKRYQENYPKSNLDPPNVGLVLHATVFCSTA